MLYTVLSNNCSVVLNNNKSWVVLCVVMLNLFFNFFLFLLPLDLPHLWRPMIPLHSSIKFITVNNWDKWYLSFCICHVSPNKAIFFSIHVASNDRSSLLLRLMNTWCVWGVMYGSAGIYISQYTCGDHEVSLGSCFLPSMLYWVSLSCFSVAMLSIPEELVNKFPGILLSPPSLSPYEG